MWGCRDEDEKESEQRKVHGGGSVGEAGSSVIAS